MEEQNREYQPSPDMEGFPVGVREAVFGVPILGLGILCVNSLFFGGMNLGLALGLLGSLGVTAGYLRWSGCKGNWYSRSLLVLSALISLGFARSDDGFVKFVMACFLFVSINLSLMIQSGQIRADTGSAASLREPFRGMFALGFGKLGASFRGIRVAFATGGAAARNTGAVLVGLVVAVPVLAVMIPLLMRADAAFEGLLDLLPEFNGFELIPTVLYGGFLGCVLFTRGVAMKHHVPRPQAEKLQPKGIHALTVNTTLTAVCVLYVVYMLSQLAYFVGGFSGILPEGYSLAEYARRGFFEMAWLCAIDLLIMTLGVYLTRKVRGRTPLYTRLACLFLGLVTLFFVLASGAKMVMYIGAYGMTRLRVLTMVIVFFMGLTTAVVSLWLFLPRLPYMRMVVLSAMILGGAVLWTDVDSLVAGYNVDAYLSGRLETVDVHYLGSLGTGAVPQIARLEQEASDPKVRKKAQHQLAVRDLGEGDFRSWNYTDHAALEYLPEKPADDRDTTD